MSGRAPSPGRTPSSRSGILPIARRQLLLCHVLHTLAEDVLANDGEALLARMGRDELIAVLSLDVNVAEGKTPNDHWSKGDDA